MLAPTSIPNQPNWETSYGSALLRAAQNKKPVAVFITNGGLSHLTRGEILGADVSKTLSNHYNAVQIDATTEAGKKMADAFGIQEGVVISDRTGEVMALRHEGTVAQTELAGYLSRYTEQAVVVNTEYQSTVVPVYQPAPQPVLQHRPVLNAVQNFNTAVFGQPLLSGSFGGS